MFLINNRPLIITAVSVFLIISWLPARADLADELDDLVGYTILASKTVDSWYEDDEQDDSFEGCSHGRVIVFTDGTSLTYAEYGYQYAYRPTAIILGKEINYQNQTFVDFKMVVGDEVYDMRR
jgi:hypothetical protein